MLSIEEIEKFWSEGRITTHEAAIRIADQIHPSLREELVKVLNMFLEGLVISTYDFERHCKDENSIS